MFSELMTGVLNYSKRYPVTPSNLNDDPTANPAGGTDPDLPDSFEEFMRRVDAKSENVPNREKQEKGIKFVEAAVLFSKKYETGIDIIDYRYFYSLTLFVDVAIFQGNEKTELITGNGYAAVYRDLRNGDDSGLFR